MTTTCTGFPRLFSRRLMLLSPADPDFDADRSFLAPDAPGFIDTIDDPDSFWWSIAAIIGHWHLHGYGLFALLERDSGRTLGLVGPWCPKGWPEPELSWHLVNGASGRGYAREAAECVLDWLFTERGLTSIASFIPDDNPTSIALARRLGARPEAPVSFTLQSAPNLRTWRHSSAMRGVAQTPACRRLN